MRRLQSVPRSGWAGQLRPAIPEFDEVAQGWVVNGGLSANARVLADVRELRHAAANGKLLEHLAITHFSKPHLAACFGKLDAARFALNELGAMSVAAHLTAAKVALLRTSSAQHRATRLHKLARELNAAGLMLDQLIASYERSRYRAHSNFGSLPPRANSRAVTAPKMKPPTWAA
jgi:hypothetical protein